jgi:hypothetical protein
MSIHIPIEWSRRALAAHHASTPPTFWPDALATTTYLLNRRPCHVRQHTTPFELLLGHVPDYTHQHDFGSLCYPSTIPLDHTNLPLAVLPVYSLGTRLKPKGTGAITRTHVVCSPLGPSTSTNQCFLLGLCMHVHRLLRLSV